MKQFYSILLIIILILLGCASDITNEETFDKPLYIETTIYFHKKGDPIFDKIHGSVGLASINKDGTTRIDMSELNQQDTERVLGHEILHILNWKYPKLIRNPDEN